MAHAPDQEQAPTKRRLDLLRIEGHDLRSPLANIRSYASMILSRRSAPLDRRTQRAAEVIIKNADLGLRLIDDLVDLLKSREGGLELEMAPTSIAAVAREAVEEEQAAFEAEKVSLELSIPNDLPNFSIDSDRVRRAIRALLQTALRRSSEGVRVTVRAELRQDEVWIQVLDRGDPLTPEEAAVAFDREHQMLAQRRLAPGVALALAKAVAEAHGGRVEAEANEPTGAVHTLVLPYLPI